MAHLTVLRAKPEVPHAGAPVAVGALLGFGALSQFAGGSPSFGTAALLSMGALACVPWARSKAAAARQTLAVHQEFLDRAQSAVDGVNSGKPLPEVDVSIALQKGEVCHWVGEAQWYELRKQTKRVNYSGFTVSIPVVKGVRYRIGSIAPTVQSQEGLTHLDSGRLYVTNKRVFFDGASKNTTLTYKSITEVQLFLGGINLEKQTGRTPTLLLPESAEEAAAVIASYL